MPTKSKLLYLLLIISCLIIPCLGLINGCGKQSQTENLSARKEKWVAIPLEHPKPMFVGHSQLGDISHLEPDPHKHREPFPAPEGIKNVALNKTVTSSDANPIIGTMGMIVDGDKYSDDRSLVELEDSAQWIIIDLEDEYELYAIVFWHFHKVYARVYYDVIVQVSSDPEFITDVTTLFNNDIDNSLGLGKGTDMHYIEKAEGKLVDAKGTKARYVRMYSQGNTQNDYNHYIEVEVWGRPAQ